MSAEIVDFKPPSKETAMPGERAERWFLVVVSKPVQKLLNLELCGVTGCFADSYFDIDCS
jgi:hypothetical protein